MYHCFKNLNMIKVDADTKRFISENIDYTPKFEVEKYRYKQIDERITELNEAFDEYKKLIELGEMY